MKRPSFLIISLWFNLLLAAAVMGVLKMPAKKSASEVRVMEKKVVKTEFAVVGTTSPAAVAVKVRPSFNWRQIESPEYPVYMANLRKVACPESTIRDIITADVNEMFVRKRQEIFEPMEFQFWDYAVEGEGHNFKAHPDVKEKLGKIDDEKDALLEKLLGKEPPTPQKPENLEPIFEHQLADFLPAEKIQAIHEIGVKYNEQVRQLAKDGLNAVDSKERQQQVSELRKQCRAEQEALLTPAERDEFKLRSSRAAREVNSLVGFDASEEELRQIARLKGDIDPKSPQAKERTAAANEEVKKFLGDDRYAALQRAEDPRYRDIYQVGSRYDLPEETMTDVYEMQREVRKQAQQVRKNKSLSDDEREVMLESIQSETEKAFSTTLGTNVFQTYRKHGGEWIEKLGDP